MILEFEVHEAVDQAVPLTVTDEDGQAVDLSAYELSLVISETWSWSPTLTKTTDGSGGITKTDAAAGQISIQFAVEDFTQRKYLRTGRFQLRLHTGNTNAGPERSFTGKVAVRPSI